MTAWLDGAELEAEFAANRALNYGDGVFRTMLCLNGAIVDVQHHLAVLQRDCRQLAIEPPSPAGVAAALRPAVDAAAGRACVIKLLVIRRGTGRGYRPEGSAGQLLVRRLPLPAYAARCWEQGIVAMRSAVRLGEQPLLAGAKHLNRLEQVLASRNWPPEADEIILSDAHGRPASGSRSNLFWVAEGCLYTPALKGCGVHGMMRGKVLGCAVAADIPVHCVEASWQAVLAAQEVFVTNSLIGIWPVRRLDDLQWQAPGPVVTRLQRALAHRLPGGLPG